MDFFGQQADARRRSARLVLLFGAGLALFLLLIGALPAVLYAAWSLGAGGTRWWVWDWRVFALFAGGAGLLVLAGAAIEWLNLADGGAAIAERLGASPLSSATRDDAALRLRNIVDEMAIASGRAAPRVFVLRNEHAINALTAGRRSEDAVLILTRGCLDRLTRDELQSVVAHEFSHLLHGDTALDARLVAMLSGLLLVPDAGIDLLRAGWTDGAGRRAHEPAAGPTPLLVLAPFALLIVAVGYAGFLLARALQAGVSRQREFLADASAIQFTRNTAGLAGVLRKIAATPAERLTGPAGASKLGHLHFAAVHHSALLDWFSTHPSLAERLAAIDQPVSPAPRGARRALPRSLGDLAAARAELGSSIGPAVTPGADHLSYSQRLLASIPPAVLQAARTGTGAPAVVLGLLLSCDPARHPDELAAIRGAAGPATAESLSHLANDIAALHRSKRLPLLGLALPALQSLPHSAKAAIVAAAHTVAAHDGEIHLFEFALLKVLQRHLARAPRRTASADRSRPSLAQFVPQIAVILSACARAAADTHEQAHRSFTAGTAYFSGLMHALELLPASNCDLAAISSALDVLAAAPESARRVLLAACARSVGFDRIVSAEETELVRAIADSLDCPLPPLLDSL